MAPEGFEPPTPGLRVQCSARLSYGAISWFGFVANLLSCQKGG